MKKILIISVLMLFMGGISHADRNISINKVKKIEGEILFGPSVHDGNQSNYYPLGITVRAKATSDDGFSIVVSSTTYFGVMSDTPYTAKQSWDILPNGLKPIFKHVYQEAISVDLSQ